MILHVWQVLFKADLVALKRWGNNTMSRFCANILFIVVSLQGIK
jgi:hypothetical protein